MDTKMSVGSHMKQAQDHQEGPIARKIEDETAKLPSDTFLWSAMGAVGISFALYKAGRRNDAMFVGQWVAPILSLGLYNKLVKVAGSDQAH